MKAHVATHIGWFITPSLQFQPHQRIFDCKLDWSLTLWWLRWGLVLEGGNDRRQVSEAQK